MREHNDDTGGDGREAANRVSSSGAASSAAAVGGPPRVNKTLARAEERKRRARQAGARGYIVVRVLARLVFGGLLGPEIVGREHVPRRGPLLVVANHLSYLEPPLIVAAVPRRITFLALYELFEIPWLAPLSRLMGALPVRRGGARDLDAIRAALDLLGRGAAVGIFPEGTRSLTPGLLRGNPGVSLLALRSGAPILPVAVAGTERLGTVRPFLLARLRRPRVRVVIGPPFRPHVGPGRPDHQAVADEIMARIAALLPPEYQGFYRV